MQKNQTQVLVCIKFQTSNEQRLWRISILMEKVICLHLWSSQTSELHTILRSRQSNHLLLHLISPHQLQELVCYSKWARLLLKMNQDISICNLEMLTISIQESFFTRLKLLHNQLLTKFQLQFQWLKGFSLKQVHESYPLHSNRKILPNLYLLQQINYSETQQICPQPVRVQMVLLREYFEQLKV